MCPGPVLEVPEEMAQPEREVRGLRNDLREVCAIDAAGLERLIGLAEGLKGVAEAVKDDDDEVRVELRQVHEDLTAAAGVPVAIAGQRAPLETVPSSSAESASEDDFAAVEQAVLTDAETGNSNMWGIAGLFCGFMTLGVLYKVVRP